MTGVMKNSFRYAFRRSIPILIGFFPVGVAYGILMADAGYHFLWSFFASLVIYAGSLQMLRVSFFTGALPLVTVALTALLLNSRHIFYGLSFIEKFKSYGKWRWLLIYGLTDEAYSLLCSYEEREGVEEKWVHIFSSVLCWCYWIGFSVLGALIGQALTFDTTGVDFALTALFIVILVEQLKGAETKIPCAAALVSALGCLVLLGPDKFLLPSLCLTVASLVLLRPVIEAKSGKEAA